MIYDHITRGFAETRISELLKQAPEDANTPEKLAELTGISIDTIEEMQAGDYEPTLHVAWKLAAALQIPLENLFSDNTKTSLE